MAVQLTIDQGLCSFCGGCASVCPAMAIVIHDSSSRIAQGQCTGCGQCKVFCPLGAVKPSGEQP